MAARGVFLPPPLDGAKIEAKAVELHLPRGCVPIDGDGFAKAVSLVNDGESELLAACNVADGDRRARATLVLIRHRVQVETGESAASSLRRSPGVLSVVTTTAAAAASSSSALGPEVVLTTSAPTAIGGRPSAALYFGAQDGLYVLYAEVDSDMDSLSAWGDALTGTLVATASAHPIRWRAPTGLAPSHTVMSGPYRIRLPEGVTAVTKTFSDVVGDAKDPFELRDAHSRAKIRDDAGVAVGGTVYQATLLPPIASTPAMLAKMTAEARGGTDLESKLLSAPVGSVARVDATRADGSHEVYGAFRADAVAAGAGAGQLGEVLVVHLVISKDKWPSYAPFIDASLQSIDRAIDDAHPY